MSFAPEIERGHCGEGIVNEREEGKVGTSAVVVREMEKSEMFSSLRRRAGAREGQRERETTKKG